MMTGQAMCSLEGEREGAREGKEEEREKVRLSGAIALLEPPSS